MINLERLGVLSCLRDGAGWRPPDQMSADTSGHRHLTCPCPWTFGEVCLMNAVGDALTSLRVV